MTKDSNYQTIYDENSELIQKQTHPLLRECMAELLGTFIMIAFGNGVVAGIVLSQATGNSSVTINLGI